MIGPRRAQDDDGLLLDDIDEQEDDEDAEWDRESRTDETEDASEIDLFGATDSSGPEAIADDAPRVRGRPALARGERKLGKASGKLTARAERVLRIVTAYIVEHGHGPKLVDVNRALCEPGDHQGALRTLTSLRSRGLVEWEGRDLSTMVVGDGTNDAERARTARAAIAYDAPVSKIPEIPPPPPMPDTRAKRCAELATFIAAIDAAIDGPIVHLRASVERAALEFAIAMGRRR